MRTTYMVATPLVNLSFLAVHESIHVQLLDKMTARPSS